MVLTEYVTLNEQCLLFIFISFHLFSFLLSNTLYIDS